MQQLEAKVQHKQTKLNEIEKSKHQEMDKIEKYSEKVKINFEGQLQSMLQQYNQKLKTFENQLKKNGVQRQELENQIKELKTQKEDMKSQGEEDLQ